jgi:hypothetical protein
MLPRRISFDAGREIGVLHEVIKELMLGFVGDTSGTDHVRQLFDPVIGQCGVSVRPDCSAVSVRPDCSAAHRE